MHSPGLTNTMLMLKARRMGAEEFGKGKRKKPAPQGENGPGLDGKAGGFTPHLGRRMVAHGYRSEGA
jgi:hypothetical protein